jgi:hypothetical protein
VEDLRTSARNKGIVQSMDVDDDEYAGAPPLLVVGEQLQQQEEADDAAAALSLEDRFAGIVQELMRDEVDVAEALLAFKEVSTSQVEQLRCGANCAAAAQPPRPSPGMSEHAPACALPSRAQTFKRLTRHERSGLTVAGSCRAALHSIRRPPQYPPPLQPRASPPLRLLPAAEAQAVACRPAPHLKPPPRDRASSLLHRSAHYLHARQLAEDLESQGATWELLLHLYATGEQPAGMGGPPLPGAGGRQTYRQALRGAVNGDASLERVAHVVAWLESLAAQRLAARPPLGFSAADGVWRETLLLSHAGGGGGGGGGGELDPDAPSRGAAALRGEDQRNEERLAAQLWQLMRSGAAGEGRGAGRAGARRFVRPAILGCRRAVGCPWPGGQPFRVVALCLWEPSASQGLQ